MNWIDTRELIALLQRFPDHRVDALPHLTYNEAEVHQWAYSSQRQRFTLLRPAPVRMFTDSELYLTYDQQHWKVSPFFHLRGEKERHLAIGLVEELITLGALDDILSDYCVEDLRLCEHCHQPMREGWLADDIRPFCSDRCLLSAYPDALIDGEQAFEGGNDFAYWTAWED